MNFLIWLILTLSLQQNFFSYSMQSALVLPQPVAPHALQEQMQAPITREEWRILVKTNQLERALESLTPHIRKSNCFLRHAVVANDPDFIQELVLQSLGALGAHAYEEAMEEASLRGYLKCYRRLAEFHNLEPMAFRECRIKCFINAAAGGFFEFVRTFALWHQSSLSIDVMPLKPVYSFRRDITNERWIQNVGKSGYSLALHAAADTNRYDVVLLLLQYGADFTKKDHDGETAAAIAKRRNFSDILRVLGLFSKFKNLVTKLKLDRLQHPALCNLFKACPALASIHIKDEHGNTPLHCAVLADDKELIKIILEREPRLINEPNNTGFTPLATAILKVKHRALEAIKEVFVACQKQM